MISISNYNFKSGQILSSFITTVDGDNFYGDKHIYNIIKAPHWLSFNQINDTLFFEGLPPDSEAGRYNLIISVSDSKMETTLKDFFISLYNLGSSPINIFPNPVIDYSYILIEINCKSEVDFSVVSLSGQLTSYVFKNVLEKGFYKIPLISNHMSAGGYVLRARIFEFENKNVKEYRIKFLKL